MKILLLNDTIISKNLGCQLVSHMLRDTFKQVYDEVEITFVNTLQKSYLEQRSKFKKEYDVVYVNGEGSMSAGGELKLYEAVKASLKRAPAVYLCNFTFDPRVQFQNFVRRGEISKWLSVFKHCKAVTVRDPISYEFLKNAGVNNLYLAPDIGTAIYDLSEKKQKNVRKRIMFGAGSFTKSSLFNSEKNVNNFSKIINHFAQKGYECDILDWPSNPVSDGQFLRGIKGPNIFHKKLNFQDYYENCKDSLLNVTGRHHGSVMSYAASCPFMTYKSNMWKTEGDLMFYQGSMQDYWLQADIKNFNTDQWIAKIEHNLNRYEEICEQNRRIFSFLSQYHLDQVKIVKESIYPIAQSEELSKCMQEANRYLLNLTQNGKMLSW